MLEVQKRYYKFVNYAENANLISPLVHIGQFKVSSLKLSL